MEGTQHVGSVFLEFLQSPVVVDVRKTKALELGDKAEVLVAETETFFGRALLAEVYNHVVDENRCVYRFSASVAERLSVP